MIKDIEEFYSKTKQKSISKYKGKWPIEWIHIFHKEYPRFPVIKLHINYKKGEFERLLAERHSYRNFSNKPITLNLVAKILNSCRITTKLPKKGAYLSVIPERRTYPSAGARYPTEIYLIAFNIKGIAPGAYHYNVKKSSLEILLTENLKKYEKDIISPHLKNAAAAIILTSVISRSEVKYEIKSYPYSLIEAGHIGQNILLSCCKYEIGACPIGGFVNDRITAILDLTTDELPVYVIGMGCLDPQKKN